MSSPSEALDKEEEDTEQESENSTVVSHLQMTDEEIGNMDFDTMMANAPTEDTSDAEDEREEKEEDSSDESKTEEETSALSEDDESTSEEDDDEDTETVDETSDDTSTDEDEDDKADDSTDDSKEEIKSEDNSEDEEDDKSSKDSDDKGDEIVVDYKAVHNEIFKPFKANGRTVQVKNAKDAITLMQMGANYNHKMQGLKPHLKVIRMLDSQGLLQEDKLSKLIDLQNNVPGALENFLAEKQINPLDIGDEEKTEYEPKTYTVDDKEVELDLVLDSIRDTTSFNDTMDIIGTKWDSASRQIFYEQPNLIVTMNSQIASGVFEKIDSVVASEKMLGRLNDLSDLEAYKYIGDELHKAGHFDDMSSDTGTTESKETTLPGGTTFVKKALKDPNKARKKAASSSKTRPKKKSVKQEFDPLKMGDEEFLKYAEGVNL